MQSNNANKSHNAAQFNNKAKRNVFHNLNCKMQRGLKAVNKKKTEKKQRVLLPENVNRTVLNKAV